MLLYRRHRVRSLGAALFPRRREPEGDVRRAHGLGDHADQPFTQFCQTLLLAQGGAEGLNRLARIIFGAKEATINAPLEETTQRRERTRDQER